MYKLQTFSQQKSDFSVQVSASLSRDKVLSVDYQLQNSLKRFSWLDFFKCETANLKERELTLSQRADELWKSNCFEFFLSVDPTESRYFELNYSLHGQWALYEFGDYRAGMKSLQEPSLLKTKVVYDERNQVLHLRLQMDVSRIVKEKLWISPTVILIGEVEPQFWALGHSSDKPDFHKFKKNLIEVKIENQHGKLK